MSEEDGSVMVCAAITSGYLDTSVGYAIEFTTTTVGSAGKKHVQLVVIMLTPSPL